MGAAGIDVEQSEDYAPQTHWVHSAEDSNMGAAGIDVEQSEDYAPQTHWVHSAEDSNMGAAGIEPTSSGLEPDILPLYYAPI